MPKYFEASEDNYGDGNTQLLPRKEKKKKGKYLSLKQHQSWKKPGWLRSWVFETATVSQNFKYGTHFE